MSTALPALQAATINYVNPSAPPDSHVIAAVDMTASGWTVGPTVLGGVNGTSVSQTILGPVPPPFNAQTFGQAEIFTDLNSVGPGVSRTISVPGFGRFVAEGQGTAAIASYTGNADVYSGDSSGSGNAPWTIHVDPTGAEIAGTPTTITITASIVGEVEAVGTSSADASWFLSSNFGTIMSGSASQATPGLTPFSDSGTLTFVIPLGGTFQLDLLYQLDAAGTGISNSRAEVFSAVAGPFSGPYLFAGITESMLTITAEVGEIVVPEPSSIALLAMGVLGLLGFSRFRKNAASVPSR